MQAQPIPFPLPAVNFAAGGRSTVDLSPIPAQMGGRAVLVAAITFDVQATPTLSSGSATPEELQGAVRNISIKDSVRTHFDGSFASLRLFEALERGQLFAPEPDAALTGEAVNFQRTFSFPPPLMVKPSDFFLSAAVLGQGSAIDFSFGALTDVDANCTALTMVISPVAWLVLADDAKLPPMLERKEQTITKDVAVGAEAAYLFVGLCKSNAFAAFSAGDLANLSITASGIQTKQLHAAAFGRAYLEQMQVGAISQVQGEPRAATDDNGKIPNGTALQAASAKLQPLIWTPKAGKITKTAFLGRNELTIGWTGTATNAYGLMTRILKRTKEVEEQYLQVMSQKLGVTLKDPKIDTESKQDYVRGGFARYLPLKFKY